MAGQGAEKRYRALGMACLIFPEVAESLGSPSRRAAALPEGQRRSGDQARPASSGRRGRTPARRLADRPRRAAPTRRPDPERPDPERPDPERPDAERPDPEILRRRLGRLRRLVPRRRCGRCRRVAGRGRDARRLRGGRVGPARPGGDRPPPCGHRRPAPPAWFRRPHQSPGGESGAEGGAAHRRPAPKSDALPGAAGAHDLRLPGRPGRAARPRPAVADAANRPRPGGARQPRCRKFPHRGRRPRPAGRRRRRLETFHAVPKPRFPGVRGPGVAGLAARLGHQFWPGVPKSRSLGQRRTPAPRRRRGASHPRPAYARPGRAPAPGMAPAPGTAPAPGRHRSGTGDIAAELGDPP